MYITPQRKRVLEVYKKLTVTKKVYPSYRTVAKIAKVALGTAFQTIKKYLKEQETK